VRTILIIFSRINLVHIKRKLMFCLEDWGPGPLEPPLAYATES